MFARGVGFNKFIRCYKAGTCYSAKIFIVIKKFIAQTEGVLFKNIVGLFIPSDLVFKNVSRLYISGRNFGADISLLVILDQELKKAL